MPRRSSAPSFTGAGSLVGLLTLAGCVACSKAEPEGPSLSILILRQRGETIRGTARRSAVPPRSITLALGGLPAEELTRLRERLEESTDAALRRATATLFDDVEPAPDDASRAPDPLGQAPTDLPAWTAAANVLGAPWSAAGLSVKLGPACDASASRCVPLFAPAVDGEDALVRHGRALAWSLASAALLHVPAGSRAATLRSLRGAQVRPSCTIALVFDAPRGMLDEAELQRLHEQARRALAHLAPDAPERPIFDALDAAPAGWELPIGLDPGAVLVIPRLSALARLQDFRSEVNRAMTHE